jgi:sortase (surface protein transpeptidase)
VTPHHWSAGPDRQSVLRALATFGLVALVATSVGCSSSTSTTRVRRLDVMKAAKGSPPSVTPPRYQPSSPVLAAAAPVRLDIPSIGVSTNLESLGLAPDGTMQVPGRWEEAGWYAGGPRPGEDGPAVIAGHVDSTTGPAVFFRLHEVRAGDAVAVTRGDGSVARFVIDRVEQFPKDSFPTSVIFGPTPGPTLRLVTCGGAFDETRRSYLQNLVAFASPATR